MGSLSRHSGALGVGEGVRACLPSGPLRACAVWGQQHGGESKRPAQGDGGSETSPREASSPADSYKGDLQLSLWKVQVTNLTNLVVGWVEGGGGCRGPGANVSHLQATQGVEGEMRAEGPRRKGAPLPGQGRDLTMWTDGGPG